MDFKAILTLAMPILTSSAAIGLVVMAVWFGIHKLAVAHQWNEERWTGMVHAAIMAVHGQGIGIHQPEWAEAAEAAFEEQYLKTHGQAPSAQDLRDGALDMARTAGKALLPAAAVIGGSVVAGLLGESKPLGG